MDTLIVHTMFVVVIFVAFFLIFGFVLWGEHKPWFREWMMLAFATVVTISVVMLFVVVSDAFGLENYKMSFWEPFLMCFTSVFGLSMSGLAWSFLDGHF